MADSKGSGGATKPLTKVCETCGVTFAKPASDSMRTWNDRRRYCSIRCAKVGKSPWNKGRRGPSMAKRIPCRICGGPTPYLGTEVNKLWGIVHCGSVECARASDRIKRDRISQALAGRAVTGGSGWHNCQRVTRQEIALEPWFSERGWISQYPVKPGPPWKFWLLDFAEPNLMLNVEIDGSVHRKPDRRRRDAERDIRMHQLGWRVLRIPAELVDVDCEAVPRYVLAWIRSAGRG